jgi:hypothetical protein
VTRSIVSRHVSRVHRKQQQLPADHVHALPSSRHALIHQIYPTADFADASACAEPHTCTAHNPLMGLSRDHCQPAGTLLCTYVHSPEYHQGCITHVKMQQHPQQNSMRRHLPVHARLRMCMLHMLASDQTSEITASTAHHQHQQAPQQYSSRHHHVCAAAPSQNMQCHPSCIRKCSSALAEQHAKTLPLHAMARLRMMLASDQNSDTAQQHAHHCHRITQSSHSINASAPPQAHRQCSSRHQYYVQQNPRRKPCSQHPPPARQAVCASCTATHA